MAAFIAIVLALALERFFDWSHLRRWEWLTAYQNLLGQSVEQLQPPLRLAVWVLPLALSAWLLEHLLSGWFLGFFRVVFDFVILLYCFGPANFWAQLYGCLRPMAEGDTRALEARVKAAFPTIETSSAQALHQALVRAIFVEGQERVFAVLFWFTLLGPLGAVLYRLMVLFKEQGSAEVAFYATKAVMILDWLPARLLGLLFALAGNFVRVFGQWQKYALEGLESSAILVEETGLAALDLPANRHFTEKGEVEKQALQLVDRALILMLLVSAFLLLILP